MAATLRTARLTLRPVGPDDLADIVALDQDPEVMRYVGSPPGVKSRAETEARARLRIEQTQREDPALLGFWRIEDRADGTFLGVGALLRMPAGAGDDGAPPDGDVEVAYRLARAAWGRGIATEAARALVTHGLHTLGLPRLVAVTYPDNHASQRVLDKLGFERRGLTEYKGVRATFHVLVRQR